MGKIVSKARQARLKYAAKVGRKVSLRDVEAETGIAITTLSRLERDDTTRIDFETLGKLVELYGVGVEEILGYDPNKLAEPTGVAA